MPFFLDDITSDTLNDRFNSSTIRRLTLGDKSQEAPKQRFVVCTSNDSPDFLAEEVVEDSNTKENYNAWRRRFITVNFTSAVDEDPIHVRFDYTSAADALKCFFDLCYNLLQDPDVKICSINIMQLSCTVCHRIEQKNSEPQNLIYQHL